MSSSHRLRIRSAPSRVSSPPVCRLLARASSAALCSLADADRVPDGLGLEEPRHPVGALVEGPVGLGGRRSQHPLEVLRGRLLERRGTLGLPGGTGQVDGVDVHVRGQPGSGGGVVSGEHVDHSTGYVGGGQHLGERHCGQRTVVGAQHHGRVAGDDHRRDHRDQAEERRLLRRQHRDDAGRLGAGEVEVRSGNRVGVADDLADLVRPAGVPDQAVDRLVDDPCGPGRGESLGLHDGIDELWSSVLHHLGDPVEDLRAVVGRPAGPAGEGFAGCEHRVTGVLAGGEGRVGHELPLRVVDDIGMAGLRPGERAADVELVGLAYVDASVT